MIKTDLGCQADAQKLFEQPMTLIENGFVIENDNYLADNPTNCT